MSLSPGKHIVTVDGAKEHPTTQTMRPGQYAVIAHPSYDRAVIMKMYRGFVMLRDPVGGQYEPDFDVTVEILAPGTKIEIEVGKK